MNRPIMGATVSADRRVEKKKVFTSARYGTIKRTEWRTVEKPVRGLYIGYRTVYEGAVEYSLDEGYYFTPKSHQEVWLIVENERHNPVRCLPEDVRIGA